MTSESAKKLKRDLTILAAMASEIDSYLRSDVLFWPMATPNMPKLTLGGYLMRQHRLLALPNLLDASDQTVLNAAIAQFNGVVGEWVVLTEKKAHQEMSARIRQWGEYLSEVNRDYDQAIHSYATAVEARAMLSAIMNLLTPPPYQLKTLMRQHVLQLDTLLQARWQSGDFVWVDGWQTAYPESSYWWLYGRPKRPAAST